MIGPNDEDELALDGPNDHDEGVEEDGPDAAASDEGDGDEGQDSADGDGDDHSSEDTLGSDEGAARQGQAEVRRGNPEFGKLRARAREAEAKAKRLEDALLQRVEIPRNQGPDPALERARIRAAELETARETARLNGDPASVVSVTERHLREDFASEIQSLRFTTQDSADRSAFESLCARNPAVASLREEVDERLAQERRNGFNFPRETVAKFLLGERALKNGPRAKAAQQKRADVERTRQTVRTPSNTNRSDVSRTSGKGNDASARKKRLEDMNI